MSRWERKTKGHWWWKEEWWEREFTEQLAGTVMHSGNGIWKGSLTLGDGGGIGDFYNSKLGAMRAVTREAKRVLEEREKRAAELKRNDIQIGTDGLPCPWRLDET
jgi:hypothetical protein